MKVSHLLITVAVAALGSTTAMATNPQNANYVNPTNPGNAGTANNSVSADFTITGTVSEACVLGAGGDLKDIDYGTIGIYADATTTVENVFTAVPGTTNSNTNTNVAGCNIANKMTVTKTNGTAGLVNADAETGGYNSTVFQANIPYKVSVLYTAGAPGSHQPQNSISQFTVSDTASTNSKSNAAWKSNAAFRVDLVYPTKALVAGTYSDSVEVVLAAGI